MAGHNFDVVIVGQGIAGATLAWALHKSGKRVLIIDERTENSSSQIAAGLITPITGKRLVLSRDFDTFFVAAKNFYASLDNHNHEPYLTERRARRFFKSQEERQIWQGRLKDNAYLPFVYDTPLDDLPDFKPHLGGFEMKGAQLDVKSYLEDARRHFETKTMRLDWKRDVTFSADGIEVAGIKADYIISSEGIGAIRNPYFDWVPFNPAKGEILRIELKKEVPQISYHHHIWMAPAPGKGAFFVGSTYDWDNLDGVPTRKARADIESRLKTLLSVPYEVSAHTAAVRPIIFQSIAVIGTHPEIPRLGFFNGLGSKGSLQAPWYSQVFARYLFSGQSLPGELDVRKFWPLGPIV